MKGKDLKDYWEGDLGVSYIPWSKLKPDIDLELLEDGGMIDEDTMPSWMKAKVAEISSKPSADKGDNKDASGIDTTQPPPVPGAGLLQPPLTLPLVNPFQLNNGLLPVGMNLPPGMMPNVPIGVPPPNLPPTPMMNNPLLGIGSPFGQAPPPGLLQMSMPSHPGADKNQTPVSETKLPNLTDSMMSLSQNFGLNTHPHMLNTVQEENMDVEMEDAEKADRPPPLSDQLLASLNQYGNHANLAMAVNRLHSTSNDRPNPGGLGSDQSHDIDERRDRRDDRERGRRSSRSRDRDRDHTRDRSRRDSRDHNRDGRGDRKDDRRDRNRWSDRDRRDRDDRDRRERSEKSVNDRLWEMAEGYSSRDRPRDRNENTESAPPLLDHPIFPMHDGPVGMMEPEMEERFRRGGPVPGKFFFKYITLYVFVNFYLQLKLYMHAFT